LGSGAGRPGWPETHLKAKIPAFVYDEFVIEVWFERRPALFEISPGAANFDVQHLNLGWSWRANP
jgi:hypothetical protein